MPAPDSTDEPSPSHNKPCTLCSVPRPVLVRCQTDATGKWHFVCPGACWKSVSGGVEDARGFEGRFPHYKYGGMWKNKHADGPVSARKPMRVKRLQRELRRDRQLDAESEGNYLGENEGEQESESGTGTKDGHACREGSLDSLRTEEAKGERRDAMHN